MSRDGRIVNPVWHACLDDTTLQAVQFLASCMASCHQAAGGGSGVVVARELLSICSHLARCSHQHLTLITRIFEGPQSQ